MISCIVRTLYNVQCTLYSLHCTIKFLCTQFSAIKEEYFCRQKSYQVLKGTVVNLTCHAVNRGSLQFLFDDKKVQNIDFNYMVHHEIILTSNSAMFCIKCNYIIRPHPPILPSANIITVINLNSTLCTNGGIMFQICKIISNTN